MTGKDIKPLYGRNYGSGSYRAAERKVGEHEKIMEETYQTETIKKEEITEPGGIEKKISAK